jgi:hypothetical protein
VVFRSGLLGPVRGEVRETLGSDGEKSSGDKVLIVSAENSRAILDIEKHSGRIAQVLEPLSSSPVFGSDSRSGGFIFDEERPSGYLGAGCLRKNGGASP